MENEIVIQNTNIVENNNFERVNFEQPSTILNYGQDVLNKIEQFVADTTNDIKNEQVPDYDFFEKVDKLSNFSGTLDLVEEKRAKSNKKVNKLLSYIKENILKKDNDSMLSYAQAYKKYIANVDLVVADVEIMYNSSKQDFEIFNHFIEQIKPYIIILQNVYEQGVIDKDLFEKEVIECEEKYKKNADNMDYKREAIYKRQIIDTFIGKLYSIQKSINTINEVIMEWNIRQLNALKQLNSYQDFLSLDKSILKLNGTALVGAKKQKEEVEFLTYLVNGVNNALKEGPKELNNAIKSVNDLTKDGNIKIETLVEIDKYLQEGVNLLKQGATEKKAFIEKSSKQLDAISSHFKAFNNEVKEQILLDSYNAILTDDSIVKEKRK